MNRKPACMANKLQDVVIIMCMQKEMNQFARQEAKTNFRTHMLFEELYLPSCFLQEHRSHPLVVEECIYSLIDFLVDPVLLNNGLPFILLSFHRPKSTSYVPEMTLLDVDALKLYRTQIIQNPVAFEEDELPDWGTCCSLSLPCIHFVCGKVEEGVNDQTSAEVIVITKLPGCHAYRWHQSTFHYHH